MPKGSKRTRGVPELHNELKKQVNLALTPTGIAGLDLRATKLGISRSELVEQIGRGMLPLALLPSLPFNKRHELPERMSVCFITKDEEVLYIGSSDAVKHLHIDKLQEVDPAFDPNSENIRMVWVECSDSTWLSKIEKATAEFFQPQLQTNQEQLSIESVGEGQLKPKETYTFLPRKNDSAYDNEVTVPIHFPLSVLKQLIASKEAATVESLSDYTESIKKKISKKKESDIAASKEESTAKKYEPDFRSPRLNSGEQSNASLADSSRRYSELRAENGEEYDTLIIPHHGVKESFRELQNSLQSSLDVLRDIQIIKCGKALEITAIDSHKDISDEFLTELQNRVQRSLLFLNELQKL